MVIERIFGKDIYIFEANEYFEHIKFLDLIAIEKPKWTRMSLINDERWNVVGEYGLFIGLYNVNKFHPEFMTDCMILRIGEESFFVEYSEGFCAACKQKYSAFSIRVYTLYVGLPDEAYQYAMKFPYITECLNCNYDWDEPGLRFIAIFQGDKKRYAA